MKCILSKRTCLGYTDDRSCSALSSTSSETASPWLQPAIAYISISQDEQRAFKFFHEQAAQQLCCYHSSELWTSVFLQAAQTDPCIRHAIIALSSFHEIFTAGSGDGRPDSAFALQHYNAAIRHQILSSTQPSVNGEDADRYMTASILFVCIELLQDHYVSAFSLLANAIKLVLAAKGSQKRSSPWPRRTIEVMYNRLQLQAFSLLGPGAAAEMSVPGLMPPSYRPIPDTFTSIDEARCHLENAIARFKFAQDRKEADVLVKSMELLSGAQIVMEKWSSSFHNLLENLSNHPSFQDEQAVKVLRLWQLQAIGTLEAVAASSTLFDTKEVWDKLLSIGDQIVSVAEKIVANDAASPRNRRRTFTLDHGVVQPIMCTAIMCRDPGLRERAMNVLHLNARREGLFDSALVTCVVERAAEIEKAAVPDAMKPSDIPTWARIDSIIPYLRFGDRHAVYYITREAPAFSAQPPEVFEEVVSW